MPHRPDAGEELGGDARLHEEKNRPGTLFGNLWQG